MAGMDDFLSKPFTRKELLPLLDRWLGPAQSVPAGPPAGSESQEALGDASDLLDPEALRQILSLDSDGGTRILAKLAGMFMDHAPPQIDELLASIDSGDTERAGRIAHALKTSAANVAALRLSERFRVIERSARSGDIEGCRNAAASLDTDYEAVGRSLTNLISDDAPMRESA